MGSERPTVRRLDTESVRALAHPLRVRIVGQLRRRGPATATTLARALGESSGATSYHLRALARYGFVVEDPTRGSGRERWWQAAQGMTSWRPEDFAGDPEAEAAEEWLSGFHARTAMELIDGWVRRRPDADPAWVSAAEQNDYLLTMRPDEVRAMLAEVGEVVLRHRAASLERPPDADARPLRLLVFALPDAEDRPEPTAEDPPGMDAGAGGEGASGPEEGPGQDGRG